MNSLAPISTLLRMLVLTLLVPTLSSMALTALLKRFLFSSRDVLDIFIYIMFKADFEPSAGDLAIRTEILYVHYNGQV